MTAVRRLCAAALLALAVGQLVGYLVLTAAPNPGIASTAVLPAAAAAAVLLLPSWPGPVAALAVVATIVLTRTVELPFDLARPGSAWPFAFAVAQLASCGAAATSAGRLLLPAEDRRRSTVLALTLLSGLAAAGLTSAALLLLAPQDDLTGGLDDAELALLPTVLMLDYRFEPAQLRVARASPSPSGSATTARVRTRLPCQPSTSTCSSPAAGPAPSSSGSPPGRTTSPARSVTTSSRACAAGSWSSGRTRPSRPGSRPERTPCTTTTPRTGAAVAEPVHEQPATEQLADVSRRPGLTRRQLLVGGALLAGGGAAALLTRRSTRRPAPSGPLPVLPTLPLAADADGVLVGSLTAAGLGGRLAYEGSIPGPVLRLREGQRLRLAFRNDTDAHSSLHLHGLPVGPAVDRPLEHLLPGQQDLRELTLPPGSAGTSWYHPHAHGDVERQLLAGLAGAVVVTGPVDELRASRRPTTTWSCSPATAATSSSTARRTRCSSRALPGCASAC
jgi:hypothetical protein